MDSPQETGSQGAAKVGEWQPLFDVAAWKDGRLGEGWTETNYTGRGKLAFDGETLVLGWGQPMTGVTRRAPFPTDDYEIRFEAARLEGNDFFASLTFPFRDSFCTWVAGGWGGDIAGLSSIDGWDASENETRTYFTFEQGKWYQMRLRIANDFISAWIDGKRIVHTKIGGRELSLYYGETKLSVPLGFASYRTRGGLRKVEYRILRRNNSAGGQ